MKQLVQNLRSGEVSLVDVPVPRAEKGGVVVRNHFSVVSPGTERAKLSMGRMSLPRKVRDRPGKAIEVLLRDGFSATARRILSNQDVLSPFGYSCAGVVERVASDVSNFQVGDRVACAGAGYASHAEVVWVPANLVVPVPASVPLDQASFSTIGSIALHGIRQADFKLGEFAVVIGLGLLGQITLQLLRASGIQALGVDIDEARVRLATDLGFRAVRRDEDVESSVDRLSSGYGADGAVVTASTTSPDPMALAGRLCRDRGRVVLVGDVPLEAPRAEYYGKELDIRLSRSYGPGRYDPQYEEGGVDYPIGYVRWTEGRNLAAFLGCIDQGLLDLPRLVTERHRFAEAERAYESLGAEGAVGLLLEYDPGSVVDRARVYIESRKTRQASAAAVVSGRRRVGLGVVGAGAFATGVLLPALRKEHVDFRGILSARGLSARSAASSLGFDFVAGTVDELLEDPHIHALVIATRHSDHARMAADALRAGKAVFVEKPLALNEEDLDEVVEAATTSGVQLMVGFNRRFALATSFVRDRLAEANGPRVIHVRVNAGAMPADSWVHDPVEGGGRLVGEGCHFVDLISYFVGSRPVEVRAVGVGSRDPSASLGDNVQVTLRFEDGSLGSLLYTSKGSPKAGKERIEVFVGGHVGVIDDFRSAQVFGRKVARWKGTQDKGHTAEVHAFVEAVRRGEPSPICLGDLEMSSRTTLRAAVSLSIGEPVEV